MEEVFKLVLQLEDIRGIPQFLFASPIYPEATSKVRSLILEYKHKFPNAKEIDFIIESSGGSVADAYRIIRTLRKNFEKVNIIIPYWAKSAATLLALGGTSIIMDEFGEFGPLDTQLKDDEFPEENKYKSALVDEYALNTIEERARKLYSSMMIEILKKREIRNKKEILSSQLLDYISKFYRPLLERIDPYEIGAKARTLALGSSYAERILVEFNPKGIKTRKNLDKFIDYIVHGCPDHGYIIDYSVIKLYLGNVVLSKSISQKYADYLQQLSSLSFDYKINDEFIGFSDNMKITTTSTVITKPVMPIKRKGKNGKSSKTKA